MRSTSSTNAAETLIASARLSSRVVSHKIVNTRVGTAASTMPRRPPSAWESCRRTTSSTVSTEAVAWRRWLRGVVHGISS